MEEINKIPENELNEINQRLDAIEKFIEQHVSKEGFPMTSDRKNIFETICLLQQEHCEYANLICKRFREIMNKYKLNLFTE